MKHKVIHIPQNIYDDLVYLAGRKSLSQKESLSYAIRLAKSVEDSENQLKEEIDSLFAKLRGIPPESKREIAFLIRNMSRLNRGLAIMVEILEEDIDEYRNKHCFQTIKKR